MTTILNMKVPVLTQVNASASSVVLLAANGIRKGASFYNASTNTLYLALGTVASTSAYTTKIGPNELYDLSASGNGHVYTGVISGIWDGTNANCQITETY